ncbi:MAG TPA: adenylate kinase [Jatrophihabitantaceae bacterium]
MKVLLIGPPGSGKGTQGERLAERLGVAHIAAGDLLRAEVAAQTAIGSEVAQLVERGELVPDVVVLSLVLPKVLTAAVEGGYILDGFPRSVDQAVLARKLSDQMNVAPGAVVYLDVSRDELVRRILERAEVEGRADDNVQTVKNRLRVFDDATLPLVEYYRERGLLHVIDAAQDADSVTDSIVKALRA